MLTTEFVLYKYYPQFTQDLFCFLLSTHLVREFETKVDISLIQFLNA